MTRVDGDPAFPVLVKTRLALDVYCALCKLLQETGNSKAIHTCDKVEFNTLHFLKFYQVKRLSVSVSSSCKHLTSVLQLYRMLVC